MMNRFLVMLSLCAVVLSGFAYDMRVWEDVDGAQVTGCFYSELFGKVTVEDEAGKKTILAIEKMSDPDKKYIRVMIPPKIEVEVRTKTNRVKPRPMALWRDDIEKVDVVTATVVKKSQRPFTSRLNAEVFMVAEEVEGDNYILLKRFDEEFLLMEEKDYQYEVRSQPMLTVKYTNITDNKPKGELYKGHLLIITSMQGDVVATDSNLPKWMQQPEVVENLRELSKRGAPSLRSRHFDKSGKQVPPPRPTSCPMRTT